MRLLREWMLSWAIESGKLDAATKLAEKLGRELDDYELKKMAKVLYSRGDLENAYLVARVTEEPDRTRWVGLLFDENILRGNAYDAMLCALELKHEISHSEKAQMFKAQENNQAT